LEKGIFTYIALGLLVWAISGTVVAGYYFVQYNTYQNEYANLAGEFNTLSDAVVDLSDALSGTIGDLSENFTGEFNTLSGTVGDISEIMNSISLKANILLSYGNETKIWYNSTALPLGSTAFTAILAIADIEYTDYGAGGILVTSINGAVGNSTHFWLLWGWDAETSEWALSNVGASEYIIHRGDTIAWTYEIEYPPPQPR